MQIQLMLCLLLAMPAWAVDENVKVKQVFAKYELILSKGQKDLVPQVFSEKYMAERGGTEKFKTDLTVIKVPAYELEIQPGAMSKDVKLVKMIPKGHKGHVDNIFILKRRPSGEWLIEGTMTNED